MARPVRKLWRMRTVVRRRHRSWMSSMILASLGWGVWWIEVVLTRFRPESAPSLGFVSWLASSFALVGLLLAVWTIRAKAAWILITLVPLLANTSLLAMPWVTKKLHWIRDDSAFVVPMDGSRSATAPNSEHR